MFTVNTFLEVGQLKRWAPETAPYVRDFLYRPDWIRKVNALPGPRRSTLIPGLSPRGAVFGCADAFARGDKASSLVRPVGTGMDPLFKRMRSPNEVVVEMRTTQTRTFGFFAQENVYVAVTMETANLLKHKPLPLPDGWVDPYLVQAEQVQNLLKKYISPQSVDWKTDVELLVTP